MRHPSAIAETVRSQPLRRGDRVELRSPAEILATLDQAGAHDGLVFMPEMLSFLGRELVVAARVERACDTIGYTGVRRMPDTVVLESVRCGGEGHGGCQAACLIYWKEAWLRPVGSDGPSQHAHDDAFDRLATLAAAATRRAPAVPPDAARYRCQATDFLDSSAPLRRWELRSFLREVTSGNVALPRFVRVFAQAVFDETRIRLGLRDPKPFKQPGTERPEVPATALERGTVVRVRAKREIARTLDAKSMLRGLWFDREMLPYCGTTTVVQDRVVRFIDERTGEMIHLSSDAYILEGVVCRSCVSDGRWFCVREIHSWWRQAWLEERRAIEPLSTHGRTPDPTVRERPLQDQNVDG